MLKVKRIYEKPARTDGTRVLVDRLWPRGLSKAGAQVDLWMKEIAPSGTLRKWFSHDPSRWNEFRRRYRAELRKSQEPVEELRALARRQTVTLLFGARNEEFNNARALKEYLEKKR